jgi:hypothetical protein
MNNYTGSSVLYTAEFLKSKSDKIAKTYIEESLHKLYVEINNALITASDEGLYSVTIQKNIIDKYKLIVIHEAINKLKEVGYKVEASTISPTFPGLPIVNEILIKWD